MSSVLEKFRQGRLSLNEKRDIGALITVIENAGDGPLPDNLEALREAAPVTNNGFLEYACETFGIHDLIVRAYEFEDWPEYVKWHIDGWNILAFNFAMLGGFDGPDYWRTLTSLYTMAHHTTPYIRYYAEFYCPEMHMGIVPQERRAAMNADELLVFDALPPTVKVYRGATPDNCRGMSWTLDLSVAEFFARRTKGEVFTVEVPKEAVLVYYSERQESEVLIHPDDLPEPKSFEQQALLPA